MSATRDPIAAKKRARASGVSVRTLHHDHTIGLLVPASVGGNRYRYDGNAALRRLQQILFYRDLGLGLMEIAAVLDDPGFDPVVALQAHRARLVAQRDRSNQLIPTARNTDRSSGRRVSERRHPCRLDRRLPAGPDHAQQPAAKMAAVQPAGLSALLVQRRHRTCHQCGPWVFPVTSPAGRSPRCGRRPLRPRRRCRGCRVPIGWLRRTRLGRGR